MAFDEGLAQRIRELLASTPGIEEKKMFGGLCFLDRGNMVGGIVGSELMMRVGAEKYDEALNEPHVRKMDFTGRSMRGMIYVGEAGIEADENLEKWLKKGLAFTQNLPAK
ncbi:MAG: RNA methyltransferase [Calditrichaeota bacterium]|nr:MAG: RNA methyltransferase [Calditrichota bacterium]